MTFLQTDPHLVIGARTCRTASLDFQSAQLRSSRPEVTATSKLEETARRGHPPSRMCWSCTMSRYDIVACNAHQLGEMDNRHVRDRDMERYHHWYVKGAASQAPFNWCSICPSPATAHCQVKSKGAGGKVKVGCGLMVCGPCGEELANQWAGNLSAMINAKEKQRGGGGMRADANFLSRKGYMIRRFS